MTLSFTRWVRGQYPFASVALLREQLYRDIATVGRWAYDQAAPAAGG